MPQLLLIFLFAAAVRALTEQTRRDLAKWRGRPARPARPGRLANWWRRHVTAGNAGYWGHQAAHGFPTARHGLHDGWTRGREAHHRAQRGIERNRAERAEGQAEHEPEMAGYRRRRAGALAEMERQRQQEEIDRAHAEAELEGQQREQHPEWFGGAEPVLCGHQGMPCRWPEHCSCQCEQCLAARAAAPSGETGPPPEDEQQEHDWPEPEQQDLYEDRKPEAGHDSPWDAQPRTRQDERPAGARGGSGATRKPGRRNDRSHLSGRQGADG